MRSYSRLHGGNMAQSLTGLITGFDPGLASDTRSITVFLDIVVD